MTSRSQFLIGDIKTMSQLYFELNGKFYRGNIDEFRELCAEEVTLEQLQTEAAELADAISTFSQSASSGDAPASDQPTAPGAPAPDPAPAAPTTGDAPAAPTAPATGDAPAAPADSTINLT
jgi:hypothetical protein